MGAFLTGWAVADVTPRLPVSLRGQFQERIATEVHSPLRGTVFMIREEQGPVSVLISIDTAAINAQLQAELSNRIAGLGLEGISAERIVVLCTHAHTAPFYEANYEITIARGVFDYPSYDLDLMHPPEYFRLLSDRITEAAQAAYASMQPSTLAQGLAYVTIGFNRLVHNMDGSAHMYGDTKSDTFNSILGGTDPGVELLYFFDQKQELIGLVASAACPSQVVENESKVSSDYWGELRKKLNAHFGREFPVLAICGSAGDVSTRDLVRRGKAGHTDDVFAQVADIGDRLSAAILRTLEQVRDTQVSDLRHFHEIQKCKLPMKTVTEEEFHQAQKDFDALIAEGGEYDSTGRRNRYYLDKWWTGIDALRYAGIIGRWELQKNGSEVETVTHLIRLGDAIIITNSFEFYLDYGLRIKGRVNARQVISAQLACDSFGYLPTPKVAAAGGYGTNVMDGVVAIEGGVKLTDLQIEWGNALMEK